MTFLALQHIIIASVTPPVTSPISAQPDKQNSFITLFDSIVSNTNWTFVFGMIIAGLTIAYYLKEILGPWKIKDESLRESAYIKELKENSDKAALLVKETAEKVEIKLHETAEKVEIKLQETANKVEIRLRETAERVEVRLKDNTEKVSLSTEISITYLQDKMSEFQEKVDILNKEIEKLKNLVTEKDHSIAESENKIKEIKESQKKLAIYVDELLRQMIEML